MAHPGVANDFNDEDAKKYYTYYQWVCFVLFFQVIDIIPRLFLFLYRFCVFQAVACYVPKFLWDATEGGLMRSIVMGLNIGICREDEKCAKKQALIEYVLKRLRVSLNCV